MRKVLIRNGTLEIDYTPGDYSISDKDLDIMLHADKLSLAKEKEDTRSTWLYLYMKEALFGSIWLETKEEINGVLDLIKEVEI